MKKLFILPAVLFISHSCFSQTLTSEQVHRIGDYGKLWSVLKLFHPRMADGRINEDSLLINNIGGLLTNPSAANFKNAVTNMINRMQDPFTAIEDTAKKPVDSIVLPNRPLLQWHEDSIATVYIDNNFAERNYNDDGTDTVFLRLIDTLKNAHGVIVDLRSASDKDAGWNYMRCVEKLFSYLTDNDLSYPLTRTRMHYGHESQGWDMSWFYYQGWFLRNTFINKMQPKSIHKPVCVLINRFSASISFPIAAMQQEGNALVVADDSIGNKFDYTSAYYAMRLADNIKVNIGTGEAVYKRGKVFSPDITVKRTNAGNDSSIMKVALASFRDKERLHPPAESLSNIMETPQVKGYDSLTYPPAPLRLLGLMRYWSAINYFCPNKDKLTKNWDSVLYEYVPRFLAAKDSMDYIKAVAQLITEIHDGHGWLGSRIWEKLYRNIPELQVKYIDNKSIVYKIYNDSLKRVLSPGDEILEVDNVPVKKVRDWFAQYRGASNDVALQRGVSQDLLSGPDSSTVEVTFLHNGVIKDLQLKRNMYRYSNGSGTKKKEEPAWKKLNNKTGYVDFGRLQVPQIDSMFNDLKNTAAIILDDRSYPKGTVWTFINYLTDKPVTSAKGTTMIADSPDPLTVTTQDQLWTLPVTPNPIQYKGKLIILVNETTQSQAEYSCMVLQAAYKKVTIIGSQTAGADGDVTGIIFPGGIQTAFSGHGIHYPDGRPTQGIGIVPDIKISPTIKGIKAGKDEVLERAIKFAATGK